MRSWLAFPSRREECEYVGVSSGLPPHTAAAHQNPGLALTAILSLALSIGKKRRKMEAITVEPNKAASELP
jgi:hypothetical protein